MIPTLKGDNGKEFGFNYQELREAFILYQSYTDEEFVADLPNILHFACFVAWLKRLPTADMLGDQGLIHELAHLNAGLEPTDELQSLRDTFNTLMKIA